MRVLACLAAAIMAVGLVGVLAHSPADDALPASGRVAAPAKLARLEAPVVNFDSDDVAHEVPVESAPAPVVVAAVSAAPVSSEPVESVEAFTVRIQRLAAEGDKASFQEVLTDWRTGALPRERELLIDQALSAVDDAKLDELDAAVGRLLLESPHPTQRQALASLLASSGSQLAARYLFQAAARSDGFAEGLAALASVSDPEVLPVYRQQISAEAEPALLAALSRSLRNMDTPKARALEERIAALR